MSQSKSHNGLKVTWCSPHPNHYNSYLFDHLAAIPDVSFEAVYFHKGLANYPWKSDFETSYPVYFLNKIAGIDFRFLWRKRNTKKEILIIGGWNEPTMIMLLTFLAFTGRTYLLFSDTPRIRNVKSLREYFRKAVLDIIFKKMHRLLVTGQPGLEKARLLGIKEEKLVNFPFTTNTEFFVPDATKEYTSTIPLVILSSGRLQNAHKGYDVGIEALGKLKKTHPSLRFRYVIAGEGPDKEVLKALIKKYELTNEVVLLGWLEPHDLLAFYHSGDLFLHPSHEDPFPNAVLEAMSCGLPVIGSDAAGSVIDRIEDGRNGFQHRDGDVDHLCQQLVKALTLSAEELKNVSLQARTTALQWEVSYHTGVIKNILKEYNS
ncbi:MAG: glycosyl transferase group 1 [Cytophagaceae bacterium]|jgi:glycosyltransferase involved in cell wall biosynthesis|nr:glycosyl transferase group 1 [Cytophagaceae bacterium]